MQIADAWEEFKDAWLGGSDTCDEINNQLLGVYLAGASTLVKQLEKKVAECPEKYADVEIVFSMFREEIQLSVKTLMEKEAQTKTLN